MKIKHVFLVAALAAVAASSFAQDGPPGGGPPGGGPPQGGPGGFRGGPMGMMGGLNLVMLVNRADVQDDLQLTDDQKDQLEKLRESMRPPGGGPGGGPGGPGGGPPGGDGGGAGFGGPPPDGPPGGGPPGGGPPGGGDGGPGGGPGGGPNSDAMRKAFDAMRKKNTEALKKILTADQFTRLKGIGVQLGGNSVVTDPDIQADLALTDAQKTKIQAIQKKAGDANRVIFEKMRNEEIDRQEVPGMIKQNQQILQDELGKILTADQKAKLKTMAGKPFKAEDPQGGGG